MLKIISSACVSALAVAAFAAPGAQAADWTPKRDITFMIPYGPGGGFDVISRKIAPYIKKHLGGKVNVVPKNVQGGNGAKAAIELARSKPNGTSMLIFNLPGHAVDNIEGKTNRYDMTKYTWLGRIATAGYVLAVSSNSKFKTLKDLIDLKRPIKQAELGRGATSYMASGVLWKTVGKEVKFITGYKSSAQYALATIRGDGDVVLLATGSFTKYIGGKGKKGGISPSDLRAVLELTTDKSQFSGVQNAVEAGYPSLANLGLSRIVATTPKTPKNIASVLEEALKKAVLDPEFVAWAKKVRRGPISHLDGEATAKLVSDTIKSYAEANK
jgi:tripartite-type tricarboxylate transporter receptor subunit TctC